MGVLVQHGEGMEGEPVGSGVDESSWGDLDAIVGLFRDLEEVEIGQQDSGGLRDDATSDDSYLSTFFSSFLFSFFKALFSSLAFLTWSSRFFILL